MESRCGDSTVVAPVPDRLALVGCKLHAWLDRHSSQDTKRGSDGIDILQLLRQHQATDPTPPTIDGLAEAVRWASQQVLLAQPTLVRRLVLVHADTDIDIDEIRLLGQELIELLG